MRCYVDMLLITSTANIKTWERDNGLYGGLSPLARGTRALPEWGLFCTRFIPAGAGNSKYTLWLMTDTTVYPRWRGELLYGAFHQSPICGLSPLARGTHGKLERHDFWFRFIPAGAGNSFFHSVIKFITPVYPRWRGELSKHNLLLINDFLSQSQSTNFTVSHKQHIHYVKEHLTHWLKR